MVKFKRDWKQCLVSTIEGKPALEFCDSHRVSSLKLLVKEKLEYYDSVMRQAQRSSYVSPDQIIKANLYKHEADSINLYLSNNDRKEENKPVIQQKSGGHPLRKRQIKD